MAAKKTEISYTPEELEEINRIVGIVTGETPVIPAREITPRVPVQPEADEKSAMPEEEELPEPSGIEPERETEFHDIEQDRINTEELHADTDLFPEEAEEIHDTEIEDITGSITEAPEELPEGEEILSLDDSDISFIDETEEKRPEPSGSEMMDEFEDIEGFDVEEAPAPRRQSEAISIESADDHEIPDFNEISVDEGVDIPEADDHEIPEVDLDSIVGEVPESRETAIPEMEDLDQDEIQFDDFGNEPAAEKLEAASTMDEFDDFHHEELLDDFQEEKPAAPVKKDESPGFDDFSDIEPAELGQDISLSGKESRPSAGDEDILTIEPLEDEEEPSEKPSRKRQAAGEETGEETSGVELSDRDLARLKKAMVLFNPAIRHTIRDVVVNDLLPPADTKKLVDMIVSGKSEDSIHKYLEKKLKTRITLTDESGQRRRVIAARPEYTLEGRERQKKLLKLTKIFSASALIGFIIMIISYQFIYKPYMAKRLINQGVELILGSSRAGNRIDRKPNYDKAEALFKEVNDEYVENYLYGYNQYARAYLKMKDYNDALKKLNDAYIIDRTNVDTLNNLGYFYAKIDKNIYPAYKPNVTQWYFGGKKDEASTATNLDLAINFFKRALLVDDENITALVGIGNAYYLQGQYLKAIEYYKSILKVDPDSVVGYSGLLNLYIERDAFPLVGTLHAEIREKDMLEELPSPLLAKLAAYYLDKRKQGDSSIRIDYGVTTPRLKDSDDNTYPAVREVLGALNEKDPDYPPLHVQFARLSQAQQNLEAMKRYLDRALELNDKYFSALHLMGEYFYMINDPVSAYRYLSSAVQNYYIQPEFTQDEFYRETENRGKTYYYLGNIFYYYFDKIKSREGGLDEEVPDEEIERMNNYTTAQNYYTLSYNDGFSSPELNYNLGRIYYLKGQNTFALERWLQLYDDFVQSPELMLPLGNAFYKNEKYDAAKGEYLKMIYVMEYEADKRPNPDFSKKSNVKLFQSLATGYNNLGAVYQMLQEYDKRDLAYWKAIEYSQRMGRENEYARTNLARSHRNAEPFIDDSIPFSIDFYLADWRK